MQEINELEDGRKINNCFPLIRRDMGLKLTFTPEFQKSKIGFEEVEV